MLIRNQADIDVKTKYGQTPLDIALMCRHLEIAKILMEHGAIFNVKSDRQSLLHLEAAMKGDLCKWLIQKGANIEAKDCFQRTPVFEAVLHRKYNNVKELIFQGADVDVKDISDITPLELAIELEHWDITDLLVRSGAKLNVRFKSGNTPMEQCLKQPVGSFWFQAKMKEKQIQSLKCMLYAQNC